MMKAEVSDYEIGKRHLANIMGENPETFTQEDVDVSHTLVNVLQIFYVTGRHALHTDTHCHSSRYTQTSSLALISWYIQTHSLVLISSMATFFPEMDWCVNKKTVVFIWKSKKSMISYFVSYFYILESNRVSSSKWHV